MMYISVMMFCHFHRQAEDMEMKGKRLVAEERNANESLTPVPYIKHVYNYNYRFFFVTLKYCNLFNVHFIIII